MARLNNPYGQDKIDLEAAFLLIQNRIKPVVDVVTLPLEEGVGRIVAKPLQARFPAPPFDNAAVDGYAFAHRDEPDSKTASGIMSLELAGEVSAGTALNHAVGALETVHIFTGAPLPEGTDTVIMQEDAECTRRGEKECVNIPHSLKKGSNRRLAGEDVKEGVVISAPGSRLDEQQIALAIATGCVEASVFKKPVIGLFSTGDELVAGGESRKPGQIFDSNRPMVKSLMERYPCEIRDYGIIPDQENILWDRMEKASDCDMLIASGGMSEGRKDYMRHLMEKKGEMLFHNLPLKPGRPVGLSLIKTQKEKIVPVLGLPGNPVAVFTLFCFLVRPLIARLCGENFTRPAPLMVQACFEAQSRPGGCEFIRVKYEDGEKETLTEKGPAEKSPESNLPRVKKHGKSGAAILSSLVGFDGFVMLDEKTTRLEYGDVVPFLPLNSLLR